MDTPTVVVTRGRFGPTSGRVLEQVRGGGLLTRDALAVATGLSPATVNRVVTCLVDSGLLRERPDRATLGRNGRPGTPVEVDVDEYVVFGVHLGLRVTTVALGDLAGRVLASGRRDRLPDDPPDFAWIGRQLVEMMGLFPRRVPLTAGLVAPFAEIGLDRRAAGKALEDTLGLEVSTCDHIAAVAATEFIHRRHGRGAGANGVTAYLYVRNTAGFAVASESEGATEVSRVSNLAHFPTRSTVRCGCGRTGCLLATVSDHAVAHAALNAGLVTRGGIGAVYSAAADGLPAARRLLATRARLLGEAAAVVRDMVDPGRLVLVGQAFTDHPEVLDEVVGTFVSSTALPPMELSFTRFGADIQGTAACTIAARPVYDDPLAALPAHRRSGGRRAPRVGV